MNSTTMKLSLIDAKLYYGTPNTTGSANTLCTTVENVGLKVTYTEAKANNRNTPIEQSLPSLAAVSLEVNFPSDSADLALQAFRTAALNRYPIPIKVADGSEQNSYQFSGTMGVYSVDNDQPLPNVPQNKFELKPWAVGASGTQPSLSY